MNLRDQLLKAGLASKKQAKQAETSARLERRKNLKEERETGLSKEDEIKQLVKKEQEERKERDRELNLELEKQRREQEKFYQAQEIVISNDERDRHADLTYRFVVDNVFIRSILVTPLQLRKLAEGELGIARLAKDEDHEKFYLLAKEDCLRVKNLTPDMIICLHPSLQEGETLDYSWVDDEYFRKLFQEEYLRRSRLRTSQRDNYQRFRKDEQKQAHFG
jgi:uncharacterized protein YaiL (DUF2058 family)